MHRLTLISILWSAGAMLLIKQNDATGFWFCLGACVVTYVGAEICTAIKESRQK